MASKAKLDPPDTDSLSVALRRHVVIRIWSDTVELADAIRDRMSAQGCEAVGMATRYSRPAALHRAVVRLAREMGIGLEGGSR